MGENSVFIGSRMNLFRRTDRDYRGSHTLLLPVLGDRRYVGFDRSKRDLAPLGDL